MTRGIFDLPCDRRKKPNALGPSVLKTVFFSRTFDCNARALSTTPGRKRKSESLGIWLSAAGRGWAICKSFRAWILRTPPTPPCQHHGCARDQTAFAFVRTLANVYRPWPAVFNSSGSKHLTLHNSPKSTIPQVHCSIKVKFQNFKNSIK